MSGRTRILLLSPHPDDIAWSLGGMVSRLRAAGAQLFAVTFFGRTRYAPGSAAHGSSAATAVRGAEEDTWASLAGVRVDRGYLPDASLRGYDDDTEMGAEPSPEIVRAAGDHLCAALAAVRPHLTCAPLAAGCHVDHRAVRLAVAASRQRLASGLLWYEDLPYAEGSARPGTDDPVLIDVSSHWRAKEAGVRCYPSQLPEEVLPILGRHAAAVAAAASPVPERTCTARAERLWADTCEAGQRLRHLADAVPGADQPSRGSVLQISPHSPDRPFTRAGGPLLASRYA
jgi:LmbE family N-acetylglucosaminyl deacetylase